MAAFTPAARAQSLFSSTLPSRSRLLSNISSRHALSNPLYSQTNSIARSTRLFSASSAAMTRISDTIKSDHRDIEAAYKNIVNAKEADEQTRWQNQFTWELARHSIGEELVVYPEFEKHLAEGKQMADKDRQEHQVVKELLKEFQNMKPGDPKFMPTIHNLMDNLSKHIKEEEEQDLPRLEQALDQAQSEKMSKSFGRTKAFVPSRSHPSAPDKPPFETAIGLMTAPMDHIADIFRKFPDHSISPNPSTK